MDKTVRWGVFWLTAALAASTLLLLSQAQAALLDVVIEQTKDSDNNREVMLRNDFVGLSNLTPDIIRTIAR